MTDDLSGIDQKISDRFIKMIFLVQVETAVKSDIKSGFGVVAFSTSDAVLGLFFSLQQSPSFDQTLCDSADPWCGLALGFVCVTFTGHTFRFVILMSILFIPSLMS